MRSIGTGIGNRRDPRPVLGQHAGDRVRAHASHITGNLTDWDRTERLGAIQVPALLISGEFDESLPGINQVLLDGLPMPSGRCSRVSRIWRMSKRPSAMKRLFRYLWCGSSSPDDGVTEAAKSV